MNIIALGGSGYYYRGPRSIRGLEDMRVGLRQLKRMPSSVVRHNSCPDICTYSEQYFQL